MKYILRQRENKTLLAPPSANKILMTLHLVCISVKCAFVIFIFMKKSFLHCQATDTVKCLWYEMRLSAQTIWYWVTRFGLYVLLLVKFQKKLKLDCTTIT